MPSLHEEIKKMKRSRAQTVGLCLVLENSATQLPDLAESVRGELDYWTVLDSGSGDDGLGAAWSLFDYIPGMAIPADPMEYEDAMNAALVVASIHTAWLFVMRPDERLDGNIPTRVPEQCTGLEVRIRMAEMTRWEMRLIRADGKWKWEGSKEGHLVRTDDTLLTARSNVAKLQRLLPTSESS